MPATFRIAKFAVASGVGFLIAEAILVAGVIEFYHTTKVPGISSSPTILGLDALAFGIGVTAAFIINERVTVRGQGEERKGGRGTWLVRWGKYQLASLLGNVLIVARSTSSARHRLALARLWEHRGGGRLLSGDVCRLDAFRVETAPTTRWVGLINKQDAGLFVEHLGRSFFSRYTPDVARDLLGCLLVRRIGRRTLSGRNRGS